MDLDAWGIAYGFNPDEWISAPENIKVQYYWLDYLLDGYQEILRLLPGCPLHGPLCIPYMREWIEGELHKVDADT